MQQIVSTIDRKASCNKTPCYIIDHQLRIYFYCNHQSHCLAFPTLSNSLVCHKLRQAFSSLDDLVVSIKLRYPELITTSKLP